MDQRNEAVILGAGPAGISAAIYLKRAGFHPIVLESDTPGGILREANLVENYPGFPKGIPGKKLTELFVKQLHHLNISVTKSIVKRLNHKNGVFFVETDTGSLVSSAVIVATGTHPREIRMKDSNKMKNTWVYYSLSSLPLKRHKAKKQILVIGGGDIAFDYSMTLQELGYQVTIISRSKPTCLPLLYDRAVRNGVMLVSNSVPEKLIKNRCGLLLRDRLNKKTQEIQGDFILVACGRDSNTAFLSENLKKYCKTTAEIPQGSLPGLYFAGDVVRGKYRQTGIAVGDGLKAAMMTEQYLHKRRG